VIASVWTNAVMVEFGAAGWKTCTLQRAQPAVHFVTKVQSPPDNTCDQTTDQQRYGCEHNPARSANEVIFRPAHQLKGIEGDWLPWQAVLSGQQPTTDRLARVRRPAAGSAHRPVNTVTPDVLPASRRQIVRSRIV
jgi:hypothetical protein